MPLATHAVPDLIVQDLTTIPLVSDPTVEKIVKDTEYVAPSNLLAWVSGSSYIVDYYAQKVTNTTELRAFDESSVTAYQQYTKISGLEFKLDTPLSPSFDPATSTVSVSGAGVIYSGVVPNYGDMFIADVGDGRDGLFTVIAQPERLSFSTDSVYTVSFILLHHISKSDAIYHGLESRVVNRLAFDKQAFTNNRRSLITTDEAAYRKSIRLLLPVMIDDYYDRFLSLQTKTLSIPGNETIYDHALNTFMKNIIDTGMTLQSLQHRVLTVGRDPCFTAKTIWDSLLDVNITNVVNTMSVISADALRMDIYTDTAWYSGCTSVMVGTGANERLSRSLYKTFTVIYPILSNGASTAYIKPANTDGTYVLSNAYYTGGQGMSALETLVHTYVRDRTVDVQLLKSIIADMPVWGDLEMYYYTPIVIYLGLTTR